jgi:hypothetical protein
MKIYINIFKNELEALIDVLKRHIEREYQEFYDPESKKFIKEERPNLNIISTLKARCETLLLGNFPQHLEMNEEEANVLWDQLGPESSGIEESIMDRISVALRKNDETENQ